MDWVHAQEFGAAAQAWLVWDCGEEGNGNAMARQITIKDYVPHDNVKKMEKCTNSYEFDTSEDCYDCHTTRSTFAILASDNPQPEWFSLPDDMATKGWCITAEYSYLNIPSQFSHKFNV